MKSWNRGATSSARWCETSRSGLEPLHCGNQPALILEGLLVVPVAHPARRTHVPRRRPNLRRPLLRIAAAGGHEQGDPGNAAAGRARDRRRIGVDIRFRPARQLLFNVCAVTRAPFISRRDRRGGSGKSDEYSRRGSLSSPGSRGRRIFCNTDKCQITTSRDRPPPKRV